MSIKTILWNDQQKYYLVWGVTVEGYNKGLYTRFKIQTLWKQISEKHNIWPRRIVDFLTFA